MLPPPPQTPQAQQRGKSTQARIPSWLNLKSFGIPSVSSNDSLSGVTTNGSHSGEATRAEGGLGGAGTALHGAGMHGGVHPLHHNGTAAAAGGVGGVGLGGVHPDMRVVSRAPSVTQRFPHHTIEEDVDEHESPAGMGGVWCGGVVWGCGVGQVIGTHTHTLHHPHHQTQHTHHQTQHTHHQTTQVWHMQLQSTRVCQLHTNPPNMTSTSPLIAVIVASMCGKHCCRW